MTEMTGGCQCGKVRIRARAFLDNSHVCHCRMCQKASGNFFAPLIGVPNDRLTWEAGEAAVFASSEGCERGFCRDCGTPLFFRRVSGAHTSFMMGCFDDPAGLPPLDYEFGIEGRLPQVAQLGTELERYTTERLDPEGAALAARTSHQV